MKEKSLRIAPWGAFVTFLLVAAWTEAVMELGSFNG